MSGAFSSSGMMIKVIKYFIRFNCHFDVIGWLFIGIAPQYDATGVTSSDCYTIWYVVLTKYLCLYSVQYACIAYSMIAYSNKLSYEKSSLLA